ncbi:type II secretion system protein [Uliginosibacterium gangwonense]|uniref:type II secretion system protein n=1 Tax=Uliginosibacterium gangwonense TaxID=392736 RepID=UPI00035E934F|nr:type II secretion system protein [Uliginosibacterium gangwonense]
MPPIQARGFTLIELVVVLAVIATLAAVALPKFVNMRQEARVATVNALYGAVGSAANELRLKCRLTPSCNPNLGNSSLTVNGVAYQMNYGWPDGGNAGYGIDMAVEISSQYAIVFTASTETTSFQLAAAADPANCAVDYVGAWYGASNFAINKKTSGC